MLHRFTRYDMDDRASDVWLEDLYVVSVMPSGERRSHIHTLGPGHFVVDGLPIEVAARLSNEPQR